MGSKFIFFILCFVTGTTFAQGDVVITVDDGANPIVGASVTLNAATEMTDASGNATFLAVPDGTYSYTVTMACYEDYSGTVTVAGGNVAESVTMTPKTTNDVFFFIGSPLAQTDVTVNLTDGGTYNETFVTWDPWGGEFLADVPYGTYTYTLSKPCHETVTGTIVVDCNNDMGVSIYESLSLKTTNNVFFFIGSPLAQTDVTVNLTDGGTYNETFVTWDPWGGEFLADVPYGTYTYTLSKPCHETITGTIVVDCNNDMGVSVYESLSLKTTNNVFFFIGSPLAQTDVTVNLTDGGTYNETFVTWDPWGGEFLADVPYGTYTYTLSKPCHETITGTITVDCNGDQNISINESLSLKTTNDVFFFIGSPLAQLDVTVNLTDGAGYSETFVTWDTWGGESLQDVPYGTYTYTLSKPCHDTITGTITVDCNGDMAVSVSEQLMLLTENNVQFNIGSSSPYIGADIVLTDSSSYSESFTTSDAMGGEMLLDVPYGTYTYRITAPCIDTIWGQVTVNCNNDLVIEINEDPTEIIINTSVTQSGALLTADEAGMQYQWIDCSDDSAINGETNQSFTPTADGDYACVITNGDCSDTSMCYTVSFASLNEIESASFKVYPNPTNGILNVSGNGLSEFDMDILGLDGRIVKSVERSKGNSAEISIFDLNNGIYILRIRNKDQIINQRIVKQ